MTLGHLIRASIDPLAQEWERYAATKLPAAQRLTREQLRDSAAELLAAVVIDMESPQSDSEQRRKSEGACPENSPSLTCAGQRHAELRFAQGFTLDQVVSEYRAIRASVMRHWDAIAPTADDVVELIRFNESIDQCFSESISWFGSRAEHARELFLGVLGHDLRTPLGAVSMSAQLLLRDPGLSPRATKIAGRIANSAAGMSRIVYDMLDYTRTRLGMRLPIEPSSVDLGAVLVESMDQLQASTPGADLRCEYKGDLSGRWDAGRLAQLLTNLVGNAVQHGAPGKPVTIRARSGTDAVLLTIHNEGPPIAPAMQERIFNPLMRAVVEEAELPSRTGSLGLGLYIAREIARAHGGDIGVASSSESGTLFTVMLPRRGGGKSLQA